VLPAGLALNLCHQRVFKLQPFNSTPTTNNRPTLKMAHYPTMAKASVSIIDLFLKKKTNII
jgi:hypothetical protein